MKLTKKQRIALEFLAEVGPVAAHIHHVKRLFDSLDERGLIAWRDGYRRITKQGREALKEAQGK